MNGISCLSLTLLPSKTGFKKGTNVTVGLLVYYPLCIMTSSVAGVTYQLPCITIFSARDCASLILIHIKSLGMLLKCRIWFSRSRFGPDILSFLQAARWYWCFWFTDHCWRHKITLHCITNCKEIWFSSMLDCSSQYFILSCYLNLNRWLVFLLN